MKIESTRFGAIDIAPDKAIEFPLGLPGFENLHRYVLFHSECAGDPDYHILQSIDDPEVAFTLVDPSRLGFDYEIALTDEDAAVIDLQNAAEAAVAVMLIKDEGGAGTVRANVQAPLILNQRSRLGIQHVFSRLNYEVSDKGT